MKPMFTANFTPQDVVKAIKRKRDQIESAIFNKLSFIGEEFVTNARDNLVIPHKIYEDQTGNLRNSIGYIILKDGKVLEGNFKKVSQGGKSFKTKRPKNTDQGVAKGQEVAAKVAKEYPKGFVLIVVAGMEYAAAVESKGFNVITLQSFAADRQIKKFVEEFKSKM